MLFLGNGKYSLMEVQKLHTKLDEAVSILGGLQQPDHFDHQPTPEELKAFEDEITSENEKMFGLLSNIAEAFGYKITDDEGDKIEKSMGHNDYKSHFVCASPGSTFSIVNISGPGVNTDMRVFNNHDVWVILGALVAANWQGKEDAKLKIKEALKAHL